MRIPTRVLVVLGWVSVLASVFGVVFLTWWTLTYPELRRAPGEVLALAMTLMFAHGVYTAYRMTGVTRAFRRGELRE